MGKEYIAFISYRHLPLDIAVAETLHKQIERFWVPKEYRKSGKTLGKVFRDKDELAISNHLKADICKALDNSEFLIVVCSPQTPESQWVTMEIEYFIKTHGRDRVLTVLASGTPETAIPKAVTHVYGEDGVTLQEIVTPLCAVLTGDTQEELLGSLRKEMNRLAASLLDCPYDGLAQRRKQYRMQQLLYLSCIVLAIAAGFVTMLAIKNRQIQDQLIQTQINESTALTLLSQSQLEKGDRREAVKSAYNALYSEGGSRPYYADAETALAEAMYLYHTPKFRKDFRVSLRSDVQNVVFSQDGGYAVITEKGKLTCVDTVAGGVLWEYNEEAKVRFCADQPWLVLLHQKTAEVISLDSGESLLQIPVNGEQIAVSADGTTLAVCSEPVSRKTEITLYDLQTGQQLRQTTTKEPVSFAYFLGDGSLLLYTVTGLDCKLLRLESGGELRPWAEFKGQGKVFSLQDGGVCFLCRKVDGSYDYGVISPEGEMEETYAIQSVPQQYGWEFPEIEEEIRSVVNQGDFLYLISDTTLYPVYRGDGTLVEAIALPDYANTDYHESGYENRTLRVFLGEDGHLNITCANNTIYSYYITEAFYPETCIYGNPVAYVDSAGNNLNILWNRSILHSEPQVAQVGYLAMYREILSFGSPRGNVFAVTDPSDEGILTFLRCVGDRRGEIYASDTYTYAGDSGNYPERIQSLRAQTPEYLTDFADGVVSWGTSEADMGSAACPYPGLDATAERHSIPNVWVGENGLILVPDYTGVELPLSDVMPGAWAVYCAEADQWKRFESTDLPERFRQLCMGRQKKYIAFAWEDTLWVYDFDTNRLLYQADLGMDEIGSIQFVQQDKYIMLQNGYRNRICFLEAETGRLLAEFSPDQESDMIVSVEELLFQESADGSLLFLSDGYHNGMIIQAENWHLLAQVPRMIGYDSEEDSIYCYDELRDTIYTYPLLSTQGLMDMAASQIAP